MNFVNKKISDIAKVKGGKRLPKGMELTNFVTEHPYLRVVDFDSDGINRSNIQYIDDETFSFIKSYTISSKDVYISIAGTIGRVGVIPEDLSGANLTENAAKITNIKEDTNHKYLMYYLRSSLGQGAIKNRIGGTSQPKLALYKINDIKFPWRPLSEQNAIVNKLSAYDDLIENNRRRIALLEEAARQLYKEWFVRFRFPGHEHVKIVDGVPEGWSKKPLKELLTLNYGKALKADNRIPGDFPVYGSSGVVGSHNKALVKGPGIIVGRKGNVGAIHWSHLDFFPIDTVYFVTAEESSYFVYYALLHTTFINTDVAVPGLNRDFAYSREFIVPIDTLREEFEEEVSPIFQECHSLEKYNDLLAKARDLLLPKLMSGAIKV